VSDTLDQPVTEGEGRYAQVVARAHRRFKRCQAFESDARNNWLMDYKFANGDDYNNWQWPATVYQDRGARPSLTVNETRQHNLHIINEAKQNKAAVKYRPTGNGATAAAAEVYEGLYRHIANISNAQMAQGVAINFQVTAGLGYTVIEADYPEANPLTGPEAYNQEIYIRTVPNPMSVMLDVDCQEPDGTGARFGFIFSDRPKDEVIEEYPELAGKLAVANAVDGQDAGWIRDDHVREARYYEVSEDKDELLGNDEGVTVLRSELMMGGAKGAKLLKTWEDEAEAKGTPLRRRSVIRKAVICYKIIGNDVVDETPIPGTAVPIIPWNGEITFIDQRLDRKGHTRCMISAQRMMNYNWSASVEYGALQSKSPYTAPVAAIGDYMTYWETANNENHSVLPWVHRDEEGREIPKPERQQPPTAAPVYMEGVQLARQFMLAASGQYEAEMGAPGNERSGKAINERQRQGDRATYHFIDNQALAIRRQGVIVKEWIPVIYDTKRTAKIIGVDGSEAEVTVDPDLAVAHHVKQIEGAVQRIFNPNIGHYEVVSDVGPDYATERQEAFNAIIQILTQAPELINKIGDLLFKVADFPLADEMAERLKPGLPPEAQEAVTNLQKQLQDKNRLLGEAMQALTEERVKAKNEDNDAVIKAFDADTKRLAVFKDMIPMDPAAMQAMIHETVRQALQDNLGPVIGHLAGQITQPAPEDGDTSATSGLPIRVPNVGQEAATPGGM